MPETKKERDVYRTLKNVHAMIIELQNMIDQTGISSTVRALGEFKTPDFRVVLAAGSCNLTCTGCTGCSGCTGCDGTDAAKKSAVGFFETPEVLTVDQK